MIGLIDVIISILMIPLIFFYGTKYPNYAEVDYIELVLIAIIVVLESAIYIRNAIVFRRRRKLPDIVHGDLVEFYFDPTMIIIYSEGMEISKPEKISRVWRHDGQNYHLIYQFEGTIYDDTSE